MSNLKTIISINKQAKTSFNPHKLSAVVDTQFKPSAKANIKHNYKIKLSKLEQDLHIFKNKIVLISRPTHAD